jgi:antitoxin ParD1/3/4
MHLNVPEKWEPFIRSKMQTGQYASEEEVMVEALRLLKHRDAARTGDGAKIEALLVEGLDSGPSTAMTSEGWDEIEREGQRLIAERKGREAK